MDNEAKAVAAEVAHLLLNACKVNGFVLPRVILVRGRRWAQKFTTDVYDCIQAAKDPAITFRTTSVERLTMVSRGNQVYGLYSSNCELRGLEFGMIPVVSVCTEDDEAKIAALDSGGEAAVRALRLRSKLWMHPVVSLLLTDLYETHFGKSHPWKTCDSCATDNNPECQHLTPSDVASSGEMREVLREKIDAELTGAHTSTP